MLHVQTKSDTQLEHDVLRELQWDNRVEEANVVVIAEKGIVTLTGSVSSYAAKLAAAEAAHRVIGVLDVANDLTVKLPATGVRTDTEIALAVRQALAWDPLVPDTRIQSTVTNGWVTLAGTVDRWSQREDAEHAIRHLWGVAGVTNRIAISAPPLDPRAIQGAIQQALERRAVREAAQIHVEVVDGTVTLSGAVHSWAERQAVLGAAGHAGGVHAVQDHLHIEPAV